MWARDIVAFPLRFLSAGRVEFDDREAPRRPGRERMSTAGGKVRKALRCSFCGRSGNDVAKLIAGPKVFICDACVGICVDILDGGVSPRPAPLRRRLRERVREWFAWTRHDFCWKMQLVGVLK